MGHSYFPPSLCAGGKQKGDKGGKGKDGGKGKKKKGGKADSLPKIVPVSELSCCIHTLSHPCLPAVVSMLQNMGGSN